VFKANEGSLSRDPIEGELSRPRSPSKGTEPYLAHTRVSAFMDVSPNHEPTLIERGTDVHLNHPLTAQRGIHDSQPTRWELWTPHPSVLWKDAEGAYKQVRALAPIASSGPGCDCVDLLIISPTQLDFPFYDFFVIYYDFSKPL
jgi:hypothetical protein